MKVIGFMMALNGNKRKCSRCNRKHGRTFICEDEAGKHFYFGSGCVQKEGINKFELASAMSKVTVQTARLSQELIKELVE